MSVLNVMSIVKLNIKNGFAAQNICEFIVQKRKLQRTNNTYRLTVKTPIYFINVRKLVVLFDIFSLNFNKKKKQNGFSIFECNKRYGTTISRKLVKQKTKCFQLISFPKLNENITIKTRVSMIT